MEMLQGQGRVDVVLNNGHYEGLVDGEFVVSGDSWNEVQNDLIEMGYTNGNS